MNPSPFYQLIEDADIAEYAVMYGLSWSAAVGIFVLVGHAHFRKHITSRVMMPC